MAEARASMSSRKFISNRGFALDRALNRRPRHHARVVRGEIRKLLVRRLQRIPETPEQPEEMNVRDRIAPDRPRKRAQPPIRHRIDLARMLEPLSPRRMHARGKERHPGNGLRLGLDV